MLNVCGPQFGSQEVIKSSFIIILHCLPGTPPLSLVRKLVNEEYKKFDAPTTLLKKKNLIYGSNNGGVIESLYDKNGFQIALEGLKTRKISNGHR